MREHSHQQHRDPDREQIRRRPCELFVPRVKESRLCSVCGFTLIDHDVEPVPYQHSTTGSLSHKPKNFLQKPLGLQHSRSVDGGRDFINPNIVHTEYKLYQGLLIPQAVVQRSPRTSPFYMTRFVFESSDDSLCVFKVENFRNLHLMILKFILEPFEHPPPVITVLTYL